MNIKAQLLVMIAATCWGMLGMFSRPLTAAGMSVVDLAASRNMAAAVCFVLLLLVLDKEKLKIKIKDIWIFVCMGLFGLAVTSMLYFVTINLTSLSVASILLYIFPYLVMLQSAVIFKEKITIQKVSALLIAFTGCVLTVGFDRTEVPLLGILTGLSAALFLSVYTIFGKFALKKYDPLTVSVYPVIMAGVLLVPFCDFQNIIYLAHGPNSILPNLIALVIFITVIPTMCFMKGLSKLEPSRVSIISFVEIIAAAIVGIVVFSEMLSITRIFGMTLIFIALIILNLHRHKKDLVK